MKILNMPQGSDEWFKIRIGLPTSSNFDKIITTEGKPSKQKEKYLYTVAGEKVSGIKEDTFQSFAMQKGIEKEVEARNYYKMLYDVEVQEVGFCLADNGLYGCSPDGLIGTDGGVEIKCPLIHTHVSYLLKGKLLDDYFQQAQGSLFVTGRKWWDIMSYFAGLRPVIIRVLPDKAFHKALEVELGIFTKELNDLVAKIK